MGTSGDMKKFMKASQIRKRWTSSNFNVLMKHVDPFYRFEFDDVA